MVGDRTRLFGGEGGDTLHLGAHIYLVADALDTTSASGVQDDTSSQDPRGHRDPPSANSYVRRQRPR